jgi:acetate kinase
VLLVPVSLFQSIIVAEPAAAQHIARTIAGRMAMHIDTDESNAANVKTGAQGYIEGIQSEG